jgi:branched-chain amino acid transport system substrate-binding protein
MIGRKRSDLGLLTALALILALAATPAPAQKQYGPGVTDTEIKIGTTTPYSGPASAYSAGAISTTAYFAMINEQGGVNGRKINYISLDDAYSPAKTVEQIRRLIESDEVLFLVNPVGTAPNMAVVKYINQKKVPHLFVGSGATVFNDPEHYPWTMSWTPHYASEGEIYAKYILSTKPDAKIGILSQNDDLGRDYILGFKRGLGDKASSMIVSQQVYNTSDPTVDSQVVSLKASGADMFAIFSVPKFAAQAIRKAYDIDWHPQEFVSSVGSSIAGAIRPAGFEAAKGIISAAYQKDPADPQWRDDHGHEGVVCVDGQVQLTRRQERLLRALRLQYRLRGGAAPEKLRRRSDPREHHEAGFASEHGAAAIVARHPAADEPDRSASDQADAPGPLQRRALCAVQRRDREQLNSRSIAARIKATPPSFRLIAAKMRA